MSRTVTRPRIVIAPPSPGPRRVARLLVLMLAAGVLGALLGQRLARSETPVAAPERGPVRVPAAGDVERLARELAVARRGAQVTAEANAQLRRQIVDLETELADLRVDLAFFQRLLGAGVSQKGLVVHELSLEATGSPRVYRFRMTLTQNLAEAEVVSGRLGIAAVGVRDDRMVELDGAALGLRLAGADDGFQFKYFQQFEGSLSLPEGFAPERLLVRLVPASGDPVLRRFEWADLVKRPVAGATETEGE